MRAPTTAAEAERHADATRAALAATIDQLKDNLRPTRLAHEALQSTRDHTPEWLQRYWALSRSPVGLALIGVAVATLVGVGTTRRRRR